MINKNKVLDFLLKNPEEKFYLTQISQATGVADATVQHVLENQLDNDIVIKEKVGNLSYYHLNLNNPLIKQAKKTLTIREIVPLIREIKEFSKKIVLFGSCSRGEDTAESDIDLFVLSDDKEAVREIISKVKTERRVNPIVVNYPDWVVLKEEKKYLYNEISKGDVLWEQASKND